MDNLNKLYDLIYPIMKEYADLKYSYGELEHLLIVSGDRTNYLLMTIGWENGIRVHGCVVHLQIINGKIWIQRDGLENGIADDLVNAGIPKEQIVLGFHPVEVRPYTEFAVH